VARVFITGSSDGLGLMAARLLIEQGHEVVLHGRNDGRSRDALAAAPGVQGAVTGDLSTIAGARIVADQANNLGRFDAFWDHGYAQHNPINDLSRPSPRDPSHDPASDKYEKKSSKCDALHTAPSVVDSN
jgi:NAD(P)-dependent dehydrogenase (short-subunit alcohol dehydrogenase family)